MTKSQPTSLPAPSEIKIGPVKKSLQSLLSSQSQGPLFEFLFSDKFKEQWQQNTTEVLALINNRLFESMPTQEINHTSQFQKELRLRMSLIQALNKMDDLSTQPVLLHVLRSSNQHWLLRWLSLRGLQQMSNITNREEYLSNLYDGLDPQIIQLAQMSEEEVLDRVVSYE